MEESGRWERQREGVEKKESMKERKKMGKKNRKEIRLEKQMIWKENNEEKKASNIRHMIDTKNSIN